MIKNVGPMNIHIIIQRFGISLISIFIPIFLFKIGFSLKEVFLYYTIYFLIFSISAFFSFLFVKLGFKKILMFRPITLILFFVFLYYLQTNVSIIFLIFLGIFNGLMSGPYWVIFHSFFVSKTNKKNAFARVGFLFSLPNIFSMLSPVIGAFLINFFGFNILFLLVIITLFLSLLPILKIKEFDLDFDFKIESLFYKGFIKYFFGFIVDGIKSIVVTIILPIFIYFSLNQDSLQLGYFSFFLSLSSFIVPLIISKLSKNHSNFFIKFFSILEGILFLLIFFIHSSFLFFVFSFVIGIFLNFWIIPFYSRMYSHPFKENILEFMISREVIMNVSRFIIFLIIYKTLNFNLIFVLHSLTSLLMLFF